MFSIDDREYRNAMLYWIVAMLLILGADIAFGVGYALAAVGCALSIFVLIQVKP
jgi:hypothetical protein